MPKFFLGVFLGFVVLFFSGCGSREEAHETVGTEPTWSEPAPGVTVVSSRPVSPAVSVTASPSVSAPVAFSELPQNASEKTRLIQAALKGAGYYAGAVDGKAGPLTQKAIEDFQGSQGLKADGVVGPVTWEKLKQYLQQEESQ